MRRRLQRTMKAAEAAVNKAAGSGPLEMDLMALWREVLNVPTVGLNVPFEALGGTPERARLLAARLTQKFGRPIHASIVWEAPTVAKMARYLLNPAAADGRVTTAQLKQVKEELDRRWPSPRPEAKAPPCPRMVFILSPLRSGSTLLRVMLAGHPSLFAPPELELMYVTSMRQRAACLKYANYFGLERAIAHVWQCDLEAADRILADFVQADVSPQEVYRQMQDRLGSRLLVDKTPTYAFNQTILRRGERWFDQACYIHLVRHPLAHIRSWERTRFDQILAGTPPRQAAELMWTIPHQNILSFLHNVPQERWCRVALEDVVRAPEETMRRICQTVQIPFDAAMLKPYQGDRMTQAVRGYVSGDPFFHTHSDIDPKVLDQSRRLEGDGPLHAETIAVAKQLGYTDL
ncbi:MAG: sulfotransferase [Candidatus Xenobia bacterium]